jgi:hypothetical protein
VRDLGRERRKEKKEGKRRRKGERVRELVRERGRGRKREIFVLTDFFSLSISLKDAKREKWTRINILGSICF